MGQTLVWGKQTHYWTSTKMDGQRKPTCYTTLLSKGMDTVWIILTVITYMFLTSIFLTTDSIFNFKKKFKVEMTKTVMYQ